MLAYLYGLSQRLVRRIVLRRWRRTRPLVLIPLFFLSKRNPSLFPRKRSSYRPPPKYVRQPLAIFVKVGSGHRSVLFLHHLKLIAKRDAFDGSLHSFTHSVDICFLLIVVFMGRFVRFDSVHDGVILMVLHYGLVLSHYF